MLTAFRGYNNIRVTCMLAPAIWSLKTRDKALHKRLSYHAIQHFPPPPRPHKKKTEKIKLEKPRARGGGSGGGLFYPTPIKENTKNAKECKFAQTEHKSCGMIWTGSFHWCLTAFANAAASQKILNDIKITKKKAGGGGAMTVRQCWSVCG